MYHTVPELGTTYWKLILKVYSAKCSPKIVRYASVMHSALCFRGEKREIFKSWLIIVTCPVMAYLAKSRVLCYSPLHGKEFVSLFNAVFFIESSIQSDNNYLLKQWIKLAGKCTTGGANICIVPIPRILSESTHAGRKTFNSKTQGDLHSLKSILKWVHIARPHIVSLLLKKTEAPSQTFTDVLPFPLLFDFSSAIWLCYPLCCCFPTSTIICTSEQHWRDTTRCI